MAGGADDVTWPAPAPRPDRWLASDGNWYPATNPPSAGKALVWTILSAFWLWLLLPVAIHYTRKARREADESQGRYVWSRSLLHRPVLLYLVVFGCSMALLFGMVAIGAYGP
jgi:hypothetical protein